MTDRTPSLANMLTENKDVKAEVKTVLTETKRDTTPQRVRSKSYDPSKPAASFTPLKPRNKFTESYSPAKSKPSSETSMESPTLFRITTNKTNQSSTIIKPLILAKPVSQPPVSGIQSQTQLTGAHSQRSSESVSPLKKSATSRKATLVLLEAGTNSRRHKTLSVVTKALISNTDPRKMSDHSNSSLNKGGASATELRKMSDNSNTYSSDGISSVSTIEEPKKTVIVFQKLNVMPAGVTAANKSIVMVISSLL